jgi:hypothetical protein
MPALYWASTNVVTANGGPTLGDWRNAVVGSMQQLGLQGVSLNPDDVNGGTPDTFAAVTFVPLGDGLTYTVVIMVAGDTANAASELQTNLLHKIQSTTFL